MATSNTAARLPPPHPRATASFHPPRYNHPPPPPPPTTLPPIHHPHPLEISEQYPTAPVGHIVQHSNESPRIQHIASMTFGLPPYQSARNFDPSNYYEKGAPRRQVKKITQRRDDSLDQAKGRTQVKASRMNIADLISSDGDHEPASSQRSSIVETPRALPPAQDNGHVYHLSVRQQPIAARACGFGERDRRVIDPPPIIELTVSNPKASEQELAALIRNPNIVIHCKLLSEDGLHDVTSMPEASDRRLQRRLMGTLVASPFVGRDEHDQEGCFFCFPDLSCRTPGSYRLEFSMVVLEPPRMGEGYSSPVRSMVQTEVFNVYSAKEFPGMRASTELTKRLKEQGCLISVKKGSERSGGAVGHVHGRDDSDDEEFDGDDHRNRRQRR